MWLAAMAGYFLVTTITPIINRAIVCLVIISFSIVVCYLPVAAALSFNYSAFSPEMQNNIIRCEGDAYINNGNRWIKVTAVRLTGFSLNLSPKSHLRQPGRQRTVMLNGKKK